MKEQLPNNRLKENIVANKDLTLEEKEAAESRLRFLSYKGKKEPVSEQELEKTPEEKEIIEIANNKIFEKLKEYDITPNRTLEIERIHILPEDYKKLDMERNLGKYETLTDRILLKRKGEKFSFLKNSIHEMIHAYSWNKFHLRKDKGNSILGDIRSGYAISKNNSPEGDYILFRGLTEAIVEDLALELASNSADEMSKLSGDNINADALKIIMSFSKSYENERRFLHAVIDQYCYIKNEKENFKIGYSEVIDKLRKGLFNGEMMYFREFEKTFGPGTMRVLAEYYDDPIKEDEKELDFFELENLREQKYQNFISYFHADSQARPYIAKGLLKRD